MIDFGRKDEQTHKYTFIHNVDYVTFKHFRILNGRICKNVALLFDIHRTLYGRMY